MAVENGQKADAPAPRTQLDQADELFGEGKFQETLKLLENQPDWQNNAQILWRLARCRFHISRATQDQKEFAKLVTIGHEQAQRSLELENQNGHAHRWACDLLYEFSKLISLKESIVQTINYKQHIEKAIELSPDVAYHYFMLGEWHYGIVKVGWIEKQIARIVFSKLPDADMSVALEMFQRAEEVEPNFSSKNKLRLAQTLLELKVAHEEVERAVGLLEEVVEQYSSSQEAVDRESVKEACKLLKQFRK